MTNKQKRFFNIAREVSLLSDFKKARKEPDFSWNETIAKLGGYYGETNE